HLSLLSVFLQYSGSNALLNSFPTRRSSDLIADLSRRMGKKKKCSIKIFETFDRKEAIKDADYIITQIRVGQLAMRRNDECISIKDRKSTRLNSSHVSISYAVFCLKKKTSNG